MLDAVAFTDKGFQGLRFAFEKSESTKWALKNTTAEIPSANRDKVTGKEHTEWLSEDTFVCGNKLNSTFTIFRVQTSPSSAPTYCELPVDIVDGSDKLNWKSWVLSPCKTVIAVVVTAGAASGKKILFYRLTGLCLSKVTLEPIESANASVTGSSLENLVWGPTGRVVGQFVSGREAICLYRLDKGIATTDVCESYTFSTKSTSKIASVRFSVYDFKDSDDAFLCLVSISSSKTMPAMMQVQAMTAKSPTISTLVSQGTLYIGEVDKFVWSSHKSSDSPGVLPVDELSVAVIAQPAVQLAKTYMDQLVCMASCVVINGCLEIMGGFQQIVNAENGPLLDIVAVNNESKLAYIMLFGKGIPILSFVDHKLIKTTHPSLLRSKRNTLRYSNRLLVVSGLGNLVGDTDVYLLTFFPRKPTQVLKLNDHTFALNCVSQIWLRTVMVDSKVTTLLVCASLYPRMKMDNFIKIFSSLGHVIMEEQYGRLELLSLQPIDSSVAESMLACQSSEDRLKSEKNLPIDFVNPGREKGEAGGGYFGRADPEKAKAIRAQMTGARK